MGWVKINATLLAHPKIIDLSKDAKLLYIASLTYCAMHRNDGDIPLASLPLINALAGINGDAPVAHELYQNGLWTTTDTGYRIADLLGCEVVDGTLEQIRDEWE